MVSLRIKTEELSRVDGSASMVCKSADGSKEKIRTEAICTIYHEEVPTRGVSFDFAKAAWLQYLVEKMDYFGFLSLDAQDALPKRLFSSAASVVNEDQASPATAAGPVDLRGR